MKENGVAGQKLGVDFIDINMINIFKENNINWTDGMSAMMDARAVKNEDEQECFRIVGAIGDATHWECMKFLRPGVTENQVTAHLMQYLYNIPGMEDVEDVIVSSGPNTWPNWRNFSDRIIQPGDIVFMDLAALTWNGYKSCYYRTYCVGKEPSQEQKDTYETALKWLYDSIGAVKVGATTRDIALKWPSAMETWGYEDEDQAAANLWGHGLGLAQYDPPVISRIWSLDHPVEIQEGMTFALETQHGKKFRYGVRIEEMLIVKKDGIEIVSNFPVKQITVVDPLPGYGDHVKCLPLPLAGRCEAPVARGDSSSSSGPSPASQRDDGCAEHAASCSMSAFILPLSDPAATDRRPRRAEGGEPGGAGACRPADARRFLHHRRRLSAADRSISDSRDAIGAYPDADQPTQRRLAVEIRLKLYQSDLAPDLLADILAAWWDGAKTRGGALLVRWSRIAPTRISPASSKVSSASPTTPTFLTALRACWAALWTTKARRVHGAARPRSRRHRDGGAGAAACRRARLGRRLERNRRRPDAASAPPGGSARRSRKAKWCRTASCCRRHGFVRSNEAGRKHHREACVHGTAAGTQPQAVPEALVERALPRSRPGHHARAADAQGRRRCSACRSRSNGRSTMPASSCCRRARCTSRRRMCRTKSGSNIPG